MLYIVATPLGNLEDISARARAVLAEVDMIAAEDTRRTQTLLGHLGIRTKTIAYHAFNEHARTQGLLDQLLAGKSIALVSDAGTPLISDPGYLLVKAARDKGITVVPIPGPCALITALCVSGLPTDRFYFEGFLPAKSAQRCAVLESLAHQPCTLVFYESPHRVLESLTDMLKVLGPREAVIGRELTKQFETILAAPLPELITRVSADPNQQKGEFVVMISGLQEPSDTALVTVDKVLELLMAELPLKQAASLASKITGASKNSLYEKGLGLSTRSSHSKE
jgi:16S rRNA (cytidine1402-2'-O)-methyltransferase